VITDEELQDMIDLVLKLGADEANARGLVDKLCFHFNEKGVTLEDLFSSVTICIDNDHE